VQFHSDLTNILFRITPEEWNVPEISIRLRLSQGGTACFKAITYHKAPAKTKTKITTILRGYLLGTMGISFFETKCLLEWALAFQNASPFLKEKFCFIRHPLDILENFCWVRSYGQ
jgi:hypothetical protein